MVMSCLERNNMWYWLVILLVLSPILVGLAIWGVMVLKEDFYKFPFYEEQNEE